MTQKHRAAPRRNTTTQARLRATFAPYAAPTRFSSQTRSPLQCRHLPTGQFACVRDLLNWSRYQRHKSQMAEIQHRSIHVPSANGGRLQSPVCPQPTSDDQICFKDVRAMPVMRQLAGAKKAFQKRDRGRPVILSGFWFAILRCCFI
jgi:hypothetical protein